MSPSPSSPVRLPVPRHLQDCNGYCGPACVMMVLSGEMPDKPEAVEGQHHMFRRVRAHAKQVNDRRPVKSPAESLLTLLEPSEHKWQKVFHPEPGPVAAQIIDAVAQLRKPCLMLVSKGMHWVVAFGRMLREDGTVAGVLARDPAWAGMPGFFGLTTVPAKPTFDHTAHAPCKCLESDNPPGSVHERYIAMDELLSPRGLQGSPDWEGKGALALVPAAAGTAAAVPPTAVAPPLTGITVQQAAMQEAQAHGLFGRADSPPDWQAVMGGGQPGSPILVKDPNDPRDDFYLVPIHGRNTALLRTAWIMLDTQTLRLREASLLDNWMLPAFPTDQDASSIADHDISLPGGRRHRFKKSELRPNQRNLVWQASGATILPYWPLREFTAPHPDTGEQVSIYATRHGQIYTTLGPDDVPATQGGTNAANGPNGGTQANPGSGGTPGKPGIPWKAWLSGGVAAAGVAVAAAKFLPGKKPDAPPVPSSVWVSDITPTSAVVLWGAVPGATHYEVRYKPESSGTWSIAHAGTGTKSAPVLLASILPVMAQTSPGAAVQPERREITGLIENTAYTVRVLAGGPGGMSAPSADTPFETKKSALPAPEPSSSEVTQNSARLSWPEVKKATSYRVQYRAAGTVEWVTLPNTRELHCTLPGLKSGAAYEAQVTALGEAAGEESVPSSPLVRISTPAIPPDPELPVVRERLVVLDASLKNSYPHAEEIITKGLGLQEELNKLKAEAAALGETSSGGEATLTAEEVEELRRYLEMAQAYGEAVKRIKPPHPGEADAALAEFTRAAAAMSAQAGPILRSLSTTPGPDFRKSMQALMAAVVALQDTLPSHREAHKAFLEYIATCEAEAAKVTAEGIALGVNFISGRKQMTPEDQKSISNLMNRAFTLAHKVKKERDEHAGRPYREPDARGGNPRRRGEDQYQSGRDPRDQRALMEDLIGKETLETLFQEGAAIGNVAPPAEPDAQKARAFYEKIARMLFDLSKEKAAHQDALKLLDSLEENVGELKITKSIVRLLATMGPKPGAGLADRISDLLRRVMLYQTRLGTQQSGHNGVLSALAGDAAELKALETSYGTILKRLPPAGPGRNPMDQEIISVLDPEFRRLTGSISHRRDTHTKARDALPQLEKDSALLKEKLEAALRKLKQTAAAPAVPGSAPAAPAGPPSAPAPVSPVQVTPAPTVPLPR